MKTLSATCAVLLALLAYNPTSAIAQTPTSAIAQTASGPWAQATANTLDELSSARKQRRHVRVYRYYDPVERNRSFGFIGQYPGEYAWRRSLGQTVCDLGYGRWDTCQSH